MSYRDEERLDDIAAAIAAIGAHVEQLNAAIGRLRRIVDEGETP